MLSDGDVSFREDPVTDSKGKIILENSGNWINMLCGVTVHKRNYLDINYTKKRPTLYDRLIADRLKRNIENVERMNPLSSKYLRLMVEADFMILQEEEMLNNMESEDSNADKYF